MNLINDTITLFKLLHKGDREAGYDNGIRNAIFYTIGKLYNQPQLEKKYEDWIALLKEEKYNDFIYDLYSLVVDLLEKDENISVIVKVANISRIEYLLEELEKDKTIEVRPPRGMQELVSSYPSWDEMLMYFYDSYHLERRIAISDYLMKEHSLNLEEAKNTYDFLKEYPKICDEFYFFVRNNRLKEHGYSSLKVNNIEFTAKLVCEKLKASPLDAYIFMIKLKRNPEIVYQAYVNYVERKRDNLMRVLMPNLFRNNKKSTF